MEKQEFEYQIDDKTYVQRKLVLGQIEQLMDIIEGLELRTDMKPEEVLVVLKKKIPSGLAIILCEKGTKLADKDIDALAEELKFSVDADQAMEIVSDFFVCNPIVSLLGKLRDAGDKVLTAIKNQATGGSTNSA